MRINITYCFYLCIYYYKVPDVEYSACTNNDVRLTGGENEYQGRVEVCINRVWGSVCDSGWADTGAYAVCRQLQYSGIHVCDLADSVYNIKNYNVNTHIPKHSAVHVDINFNVSDHGSQDCKFFLVYMYSCT